MELNQVLRVLKSKAWFIVAFILIITTAVGIFSVFYIKPVYEASAKIVLKSNGETEGRLVDYDSLLANVMLIETYRDIVKTPGLMEKVIAAYPEINMAPEQLILKVKVNSSNNQIMSVQVRDASYDKAAQIANAVSVVLVQEIPRIMNINNVSILDQAANLPIPKPVTPNIIINIAIGFILSSLFSMAIVLLREYLDDKVRSEETIEKELGLSVLTVIPQMKKNEVLPSSLRVTSDERVGERTYVAINQ
ncbi:Wzz/FepE/Etk N-terminal domain-containing protein [Paenibacillus glycanilyticus]|uniref:YveK family protein n=1 Tax=Paenibacillus glycanilyticus TaxID=126569 RepID=UPI00203B2717|nr:Wzz/FepE/Etk N-terminal domain-containing protein [Paenibacillus glycanilyticus]MCM3630985.1 Wzz/FepE/Etk N-terminal domain-containing protein [Paenibacillus glycanilyticus]